MNDDVSCISLVKFMATAHHESMSLTFCDLCWTASSVVYFLTMNLRIVPVTQHYK